MVRTMSVSQQPDSRSSKRQESGLVMSIMTMVGVFAKRATRRPSLGKHDNNNSKMDQCGWPKLLLAKPKQILNKKSHEKLSFSLSQVKDDDNKNVEEEEDHNKAKGDQRVKWGDGGVWQREILMGDKCKPLDFSGLICYDSSGKQLKDPPGKSPRASPIPGYLSRTKEQEREL